MRKIHCVVLILLLIGAVRGSSQQQFETDTIATSAGDLKITFIGHATLMFTFNDLVIHLDPWSRLADYSKLPKADFVFITHDHADHLDLKALKHIITDETTLAYTKKCAEVFPGGTIIRNGETLVFERITVRAVPAYTLREVKRGQPHPKGECNGYILTFGDKRVYIASETEIIPELKDIKDIDIAFLAMDGVFNLSPEEAVAAVNVFKPKVIYPFHYSRADLTPFIEAFKDIPEIEVRIRDMRVK